MVGRAYRFVSFVAMRYDTANLVIIDVAVFVAAAVAAFVLVVLVLVLVLVVVAAVAVAVAVGVSGPWHSRSSLSSSGICGSSSCS